MNYPKHFEQFWKLYPGRTNKYGRIRKEDKLGAFVEWRKLTHAERLLAMFSHPEQGTYTPDARKWLKHKRWEDEDVTTVKARKRREADVLRARAQQRNDTQWIMEQTEDMLKIFLKRWPHYEWLVQELRPEIFND